MASTMFLKFGIFKMWGLQIPVAMFEEHCVSSCQNNVVLHAENIFSGYLAILLSEISADYNVYLFLTT